MKRQFNCPICPKTYRGIVWYVRHLFHDHGLAVDSICPLIPEGFGLFHDPKTQIVSLGYQGDCQGKRIGKREFGKGVIFK